jgi:hypothetical protein
LPPGPATILCEVLLVAVWDCLADGGCSGLGAIPGCDGLCAGPAAAPPCRPALFMLRGGNAWCLMSRGRRYRS